MMLADEFITKIKESVDDEQKDVEKYKELSDVAAEYGWYEISGLLADISLDEKSHNKHLHKILDKFNKE